MFKKHPLFITRAAYLTSAAALSAAATQPATAHQDTVTIDSTHFQLTPDSVFAPVPCQAKVPENCPKNPIPHDPIPKNASFDLSLDAASLETEQALQCLHFFQAQVGENGLEAVNGNDVDFAESCLETFVQELLEE